MMSPSGGLIHDRRQKRQLRAGLAILALVALVAGVWGLFGPRSFARSFPGFGRAWPGLMLPYNEHLVRDSATFYLGFAVLLAWTAIALRRDLVHISLGAWLVTVVAHLAAHLDDLDELFTFDELDQLVGLVLTIALPVGLLVLAARMHWRSWRSSS